MQADIETPASLAVKSEQPLEEENEEKESAESSTPTLPAGNKVETKTIKQTPSSSSSDHAEDLTLNTSLAAGAAAAASLDDGNEAADGESKKPRRYLSPSEEEHFLEIWGRDNWRLTKNGKNTLYFAQWAEELKNRFGIEIKPEEIQTKVNTTRAKFRQVKRTQQIEGGTVRWKKYNIIDSILKNQYRPKDAEPIPKEALKRNRDVTPPPLTEATKTPKTTDSEIEPNGLTQQSEANASGAVDSVISTQGVLQEVQQQLNMDNSVSSEPNISTNFFNNSDSQSRLGYNSELFTDNYDDIKHEYETEDTYCAPQQQPHTEDQSGYALTEEPQLHELQTPQQLQQQQQQQHQQHQQHQPQQPQQQQQYMVYDGTTNVAAPTTYVNSTEYQNNIMQHTPLAASNAIDYTQQHHPHATHPTAITNGNVVMQPPRPASTQSAASAIVQVSRKRGRPSVSNAAACESIEVAYLEEIRRKNQILEDHNQISRQSNEIEERKLTLMSQFFPKYLEQQTLILEKMMQHK